METLTANPLFQSGILPFAVSLVAALIMRPFGWHWAGLAFALAFAATLHFVTGFQLTPLNSTRKIILMAGGAVVVGMLIDALPKLHRYVPIVIVLISASAAIWLIWPVLKRLEGQEFWIMAGACAAFAAWVTAWSESLRNQPTRATATAMTLGVGVSISAVLGASALLGQLGGATAAASGALILLLLLKQNLSPGSNYSFPASLTAVLISLSAITYAGLVWQALIPLVLIPLAARIPVKQSWHDSVKVIVTTLYTLPLAGTSIYITWLLTEPAGDSMY